MKKRGITCAAILCLAMPGSSGQLTAESMWDWLRSERKADFEALRTEYNDPVTLKKHLKDTLLPASSSGATIMAFKRIFEVNDKMMQDLLLNIIREAVAQSKAKDNKSWDEERLVRQRLEGAVRWLACFPGADAKEVKPIMMGIAKDTARERLLRINAISSYMDYADAQEKRDMIAYLLSDDTKTSLIPYGDIIYHVALREYDKAEGDTQTRETIIAAVSAALAKEKDKHSFIEGDKRLAERNKEYAESPQRKAKLERMKVPPDKRENDMK